MKLLLRFFGFLFAFGTIVFLVGIGAAVGLYGYFSKDLPDYSALQDYQPPVMTRVHAADGELLAEYAHERRLYLPIQAVPKLVINAFVSAEDKNFWEHRGVDPSGIVRAGLLYVENLGSNKRPQGASTITQQVAKNMLLTNEVSFQRKIKEALLALKIERTYSKEHILELYLNQIYLGLGAYGVAAASLLYFDKSVHELSIAQAAYLAALPKGPGILQPFRFHDRAVERRNWVIDRMAENGYITTQQADQAKKEALNVVTRPTGAQVYAAEYFAEDVRREILDKYGEKGLYEGGLSVRTTLDPKLQGMARKSLMDGLIEYDERQGYRGAVTKIDIAGDWGVKLADVKALADIGWKLAVVLETSDQAARIGFQPGREPGGAVMRERNVGIVPLDGVKWAKAAAGPLRGKVPVKVSQVLAPGDVVYVDPLPGHDGQFRLRQLPEVSGAMVVMDPRTGRVLALVGGFSYDQSQFDRASQAMRQPGSAFKPFVYAAALDNGYTPSSIVLDAPLSIEQGNGQAAWEPENYERKFYGPSTLRFGLEHSRNVMTVRLAQDIGMPLINDYAKRFGVYPDGLPPYLSFALGAGETTVLRMTAAYSMIANGGHKITPTMIDRIQDRFGKTIYRHDERQCIGCDAKKWDNQPEPTLKAHDDVVLDPMTAYQITSMMEGVVQRGTGYVVHDVGRPIAGKTGTTNDEKDAWFMSFTPNLAVGIYMGYDKPRHLGRDATGGHLSAPIAREFYKMALADQPAVPFRVPPGIKLIRVDPKTGLRATGGGPSILEGFKPGTAPPDSPAVISMGTGDNGTIVPTGDADRAVRSGTGGLY
ncbi:MAG TPA: penicillin-binding protein 1A [Xanthobacteraceae bacterium]|nr:penicillin-binding protein 1A [Xanthobacteraceae bacterium]